MDRNKLVGIIASTLLFVFMTALLITYYVIMANITVVVVRELFNIDWSSKVFYVALGLFILQSRFNYQRSKDEK